jgi:hypothetical protein
MNFFSEAQKNEYSSVFNSIHESFGRDVLVIKEPKRIILKEIDENFNYFYGPSSQKKSVEESVEEVSRVFKMRIQWQDPKPELENSRTSELRPKIHANICRLKMKKEAVDFISGCKNIIVDGKNCEQIGFNKPHGIIDVGFYTIFVKEINVK